MNQDTALPAITFGKDCMYDTLVWFLNAYAASNITAKVTSASGRTYHTSLACKWAPDLLITFPLVDEDGEPTGDTISFNPDEITGIEVQ